MPDERRRRLTLLGLLTVSILVVGLSLLFDSDDDGGEAAATIDRAPAGGDTTQPGDGDTTTAPPSSDETTTTEDEGDGGDEGDDGGWLSGAGQDRFYVTDYDGWVDPEGFGRPYPNAALEGILTFRGNPSRSYYGVGPVPTKAPQVLDTFPPDEPMCMSSSNLGETKVWCGMGWTGQPLVFDKDGRRWVVFGGYDGHVHFMDGVTGERILPDVPTGDLIKGTGTIDPDGNPLVYIGSRDNLFRIIAFDRPGQAEVLWTLDANDPSYATMWNDDWDSSPAVIGDYVIIGGENSRWYVVKINRGVDANGLVTVDPQVVFTAPAWDDQLLADLAGYEQKTSVESSMTVVGDTVYFVTSGGLLQGWDVSGVEDGREPERVFRFWTGDDADATVVADDEGYLYVASEYENGTARSQEVGQLVKIDPSKPNDPVVWSVQDTGVRPGGIWGTPAVMDDTVYVGTNGGRLLGVHRDSGKIRWEKTLPPPVWGSPVVVDDVLLIGDCNGDFHAYDVSNSKIDPPELWSVNLEGCIEATPAVWDGRIYVGSRAGHLYILGDPKHRPEVEGADDTKPSDSSAADDPGA